ncbi:hypothetical protein J6P59_06270 [bacterium]|nr:hypothetical protein [bacterium]
MEDEVYNSSSYSNGFVVNDISYTVLQVMNNITIDFPSSVSPTDNENGEIPITLSYNSIELKNTSGSTSFIVDGFSTNMSGSNQAVVDELNSLLQQDINVGMIYSNDASSSLFSDLTAAQAVLTDSSTTTSTNAILLAPDIGYIGCSLKQAILSQIINEINNKFPTGFTINGVTYTASEIINSISIENLHSNVSVSENVNAKITGITLFYNSLQLSNTNQTNTFAITGFKAVSATQTGINDNRNQKIANSLNSLLEQDINIAMLNSSNASSSLFSDLTASQALQTLVTQSSSAANLITGSSSEQTYDLKQAILYVLQNEILSKYPNGFNVEGVSYTLSEVINNISLKLPSTITPTQNANAQIPITLSYNSIELKNTSGSTTFIVDGFSTNMSSSNQAVADELKSLLQQDINVSQYFSTSASQTLLNDPGSNPANID